MLKINMTRQQVYIVLSVLVVIVFYVLNDKVDTFLAKEDAEHRPSYTSKKLTECLPSSTTGAVIHHEYYSFSYNEKHEQAEWVAYELKRSHLSKNHYKRPYFISDASVKTKSADWRNYKKSGFDKGHLCPAADRKFSKQAHDNTFLTSNISPQNHEFNSGIWNRLEQKTRYWANKYDGVIVFTGGILTNNTQKIGYEQVTVPNYFYKIIFDYNGKETKVIAFLIPHQETNKPLYKYVVSVDEIETLTGIDFFKDYHHKHKAQLEASTNYRNWSL